MVNNELVKELKKAYPKVNIVFASKYVKANDLEAFYNSGIKDFGENRVEEFLEKFENFKRPDLKWHFIGHLQSNKAEKIVNKINCLHSLDSLRLLNVIEKNRLDKLDVFIEVNTSNEETKSGVLEEDLIDFTKEVIKRKKISLLGLMTMAPNTSCENEIVKCFLQLKNLLAKINQELSLDLKELSMGMSNDYRLALNYEATYLRLGRILIKE